MKNKIPGSFRDPSGFLFRVEDSLFRQVNQSYKEEYDLLMRSGLYNHLTRSKTLISHQEVDIDLSPNPEIAYKIIKPELVDFISYPYEWCFSQLKEAAILTLAIAKRSLEYGMSLKDASAYNIQFQNGKAIFIDTLSFEKYQQGKPWVAYRQFCQHFLAPLGLMANRDVRMNQLLSTNIDGIPLDITSKLLPTKTRLDFGLMTHIHLHAKSQQRYADKPLEGRFSEASINPKAVLGLLESLISTVRKLTLKSNSTEWENYYQQTNYSEAAFTNKKEIIKSFIAEVQAGSVWDLGANNGEFSRIASDQSIKTIAFDIDPGAVEQNYRTMKANKEKYILPLIMDLTNPSPSLGWHHQERMSLIDRGPVDLAMALALIHHLAIGNNVPQESVADFLSDICHYLIIEFIPKSDSQVQRLLMTREDIFPDYHQAGFEEAFEKYFQIIHKQTVSGSDRTLYLMKNRNL